MLTYQYKLKNKHNQEEIELQDFYVSSDLSYASGTTSISHTLNVNDTIWVVNPYFPNKLKGKIASQEIVKRNGYITYPLTLDIHSIDYIDVANNLQQSVKYVYYNGDIYYSNTKNESTVAFLIDNVSYSTELTATTIEIQAKQYIEDNTVTVNGNTYNVIVNSQVDQTLFLDSIGTIFVIPNTWNIQNITPLATQVQKIVIQAPDINIVDYLSITHYGQQPYIVYNKDRYNFNVHYNETENLLYLAIDINGQEYQLDSTSINSSYDWQSILQNYNQYELYNCIDSSTPLFIKIQNTDYQVYFEEGEPASSLSICLELGQNDNTILQHDVLIVEMSNPTGKVQVKHDDNGQTYIYHNGHRKNILRGICDSVIIDNCAYHINYPVINGNYTLGMTCNIELGNKDVMYFAVNDIQNGYVTSLKKVEQNDNGDWVDSLSLYEDELHNIQYGTMGPYQVQNCDGVLIDDVTLPIEHYENIMYDSLTDKEIIANEYDYINISTPEKYELEVQSISGSNKLICKAKLNDRQISQDDYIEIVDKMFNSLINNEATIKKRSNCFGRVGLVVENWINEAYDAQATSSIYQLSNIANELKFAKSSNSFRLPISLAKTVNNDMLREDLITSSYYDEKVDEAINKIVDMEKDIYAPVYKTDGTASSPIKKMVFNLHFRTRDMDTWSIYEDFGYRLSGQTYSDDGQLINEGVKVKLNVNSDYCNWFITDYHPYNMPSISGSSTYVDDGDADNAHIMNMMDRSDLLGLLYFTTDDVKKQRKKLAKSFLRLSYYDSTDPDTQNMIGTSVLFFDCDRYLDDAPYYTMDNLYYSDVLQTRNTKSGQFGTIDRIDVDKAIKPKVLTEAYQSGQDDYYVAGGQSQVQHISNSAKLYTTSNDYLPLMDSRIVVKDRYKTGTTSEGYYLHMLKTFSNKFISQTIYMKAEFFHAGLGIKIPMALATELKEGDFNAIDTWTRNKLEKFKEGMDLTEANKRLYIPLTVSYDISQKKYVYSISSDNNYSSSILCDDNTTWKFNLFELKIKPQ